MVQLSGCTTLLRCGLYLKKHAQKVSIGNDTSLRKGCQKKRERQTANADPGHPETPTLQSQGPIGLSGTF